MKTFRAADLTASPEHAALMEMLKGDLLIIFLARLLAAEKTEKLVIDVKEIDDVPRGKGLAFAIRDGQFIFELQQRHPSERN